jgi:hypothetical protein
LYPVAIAPPTPSFTECRIGTSRSWVRASDSRMFQVPSVLESSITMIRSTKSGIVSTTRVIWVSSLKAGTTAATVLSFSIRGMIYARGPAVVRALAARADPVPPPKSRSASRHYPVERRSGTGPEADSIISGSRR